MTAGEELVLVPRERLEKLEADLAEAIEALRAHGLLGALPVESDSERVVAGFGRFRSKERHA